MERILITGALGQLGSELAAALRERYGNDHVILTDIRLPSDQAACDGSPFHQLDCRDGDELSRIVRTYRIDTIYHLAAILSATAERDPRRSWDINMNGLIAVLETAREEGCSLFTPSSIGAF